jgi:hypothetical protein
MIALFQKSQVILLLKQYKRSLAWFISSLVLAILLSLGTTNQQPSAAYNPTIVNNSTQPRAIAATTPRAIAAYPDFATSHLESNFYQ